MAQNIIIILKVYTDIRNMYDWNVKKNSAKRILEAEYSILEDHIKTVDVIVLYGNTVMTALVDTALRQLGFINKKVAVFEKNDFLTDTEISVGDKVLVISCALRGAVIDEMAKLYKDRFPGAKFSDSYPIYFQWLVYLKKRNCDYDILADSIMQVRRGEYIPGIDCINTTFCNLNCEECSNGMQCRINKKHISVEKQVASVVSITGYKVICNCNIQGGEPFLYPDLIENIEQLAKNPRVVVLTIATNGTIVPSEATMREIEQSGAIIRISDYGKLSKNKDNIARKASDYGIPCDSYARAVSWASYGKLAANHRSDSVNRMIGDECFFGTHDLMLYDGKLYCCCRTLFAEASGMDKNLLAPNCLDVLNDIDDSKLNDIVDGKNLFKMCDYCDYPMNIVEPAKQIKFVY